MQKIFPAPRRRVGAAGSAELGDVAHGDEPPALTWGPKDGSQQPDAAKSWSTIECLAI
jgi:hypothetical protein